MNNSSFIENTTPKPIYTATLHFDLSEPNVNFTAAIHGLDYWSALWEFQNALRSKVKHSETQTTTWEEVQDLFFQCLNNNNVDLDEIG